MMSSAAASKSLYCHLRHVDFLVKDSEAHGPANKKVHSLAEFSSQSLDRFINMNP